MVILFYGFYLQNTACVIAKRGCGVCGALCFLVLFLVYQLFFLFDIAAFVCFAFLFMYVFVFLIYLMIEIYLHVWYCENGAAIFF